jgi:serine protease inhibitor
MPVEKAPARVFRADHPFLFFVCYEGMVLFIGRVNDPTAL